MDGRVDGDADYREEDRDLKGWTSRTDGVDGRFVRSRDRSRRAVSLSARVKAWTGRRVMDAAGGGGRGLPRRWRGADIVGRREQAYSTSLLHCAADCRSVFGKKRCQVLLCERSFS